MIKIGDTTVSRARQTMRAEQLLEIDWVPAPPPGVSADVGVNDEPSPPPESPQAAIASINKSVAHNAMRVLVKFADVYIIVLLPRKM